MEFLYLYIDLLHTLGHRVGGHLLQIRIERSVDAKAGMVEVRVSQPLHQPVAHQVNKIGRLAGIDVDGRPN